MNPEAKTAVSTAGSLVGSTLTTVLGGAGGAILGPVGLVAIFVKEMFTGIFRAEKAKAAFKNATKDQIFGIAELFKTEQAEQQQYADSFLSEYEKQLQQEQKMQQYKAGGISIGLILVMLLLLFVLSRIVK